ncbi:MAG: N-acetyltransferase [Prolixibacteraceae bacterium]|nr:N-acetyltransferase [Prolixibacteraceae bacterium]
MNIRSVNIKDACQITHIYNYYIEKTIVTFEETRITEEEMARRIKSISSEYPFLVIEDNNEIAGYAYATRWKERTAYRFSAEVTIYLHPEKTGKGYGSKLYSHFLDEIRKSNLHALLAGISLPNRTSIALHEKFGFKKVGCLEQVGFKFEEWIDVGYWELKL